MCVLVKVALAILQVRDSVACLSLVGTEQGHWNPLCLQIKNSVYYRNRDNVGQEGEITLIDHILGAAYDTGYFQTNFLHNNPCREVELRGKMTYPKSPNLV